MKDEREASFHSAFRIPHSAFIVSHVAYRTDRRVRLHYISGRAFVCSGGGR
jgi:hypothetical protein